MTSPSFGEKQLLKFGWKQGKGIGKDCQGITKPIKATKKNDVKGVGVEESKIDEYFPWWEALYNKSAATSGKSESAKSPKEASLPDNAPVNSPAALEKWLGKQLSDTELFEACGKRSAHKGARRLKLSSSKSKLEN